MATESPIRITEASRKWPSHKDAATFRPSSANLAVEELGSLLRGQGFQVNGRNMVPNRSGSAPPSMEGSFSAVQDLISLQNSTSNVDLANLSNTNGWENRRVSRHVRSIGNNWRLTSFDDCENGSLHFACRNLPTHEEEAEEDRSPQQAPDEWANSGYWSEQEAASSGHHQSLVDLTREDFPCTPSPAYNMSRSLSHVSVEDAIDYDADSSSVHDPSVSTSNANASVHSADEMGQQLYPDLPLALVSGLSSLRSTGGSDIQPPICRRHSSTTDAHSEDEVFVSGVTDSDIRHIESEMKAINFSGLPNLTKNNNLKHPQYSSQNNVMQQHICQPQSNMYQIQGDKAQIVSQGINQAYIGTNHVLPGPSNFSVTEALPILQSSGFTPPLYADAAAYMASSNSFYPNLQPSGYFSPQYNVGGYAYNPTALPPFIAGYPAHNATPVTFDGFPGLGFGQTSGISTGGSTAPVVDMQHLNKYYGQLGFSMQPSFTDHPHMQYLQPPFGDAYSVSGQFDQWSSGGGATGSQIAALDSRKRTGLAACSNDLKLQHQGYVDHSNLNLRRRGITSPYYFGGPTNMGMLMQFPNSPAASPVLPGSPVGRSNLSGGKNEMKFPPGLNRNVGIFSGWQGQGGPESFDDNKRYSFLEELKSGKGRRFELSDIAGHVIELSSDQHGSRFIQQKLENCSVEEKESVFKEVLPHASELMTDVFGNYVIQKFFEYGSPEQRKELANQLEGQILPLSLQMYGCRVIQKALEVIEIEQRTKLVRELDGHVMRCVRDQNGNHVIQKCIESIPTDKIEFIISSFRGQVATLSTHPYGCRVIQRVLEHCTDELHSQFIVDEILESVCSLAQDQYGNYVSQHVLERGKPHERSQIISKLSGHIVQLSQHKFASNVIEKCFEHSDSAAREILIGEIIGHGDGNDNLLAMMKDQYANYVVQKILQTCTDDQREMLLNRMRIHLNSLKKYTYGKHIVTRFEQLYREDIQSWES